MKKLMSAVAGAVLATAALAYNEVELSWNNSTGGDVTDVANWSGVPAGVTDVSYDPAKEYFGLFKGKGAVTLALTLSKDFYFNRYYLQSANTKYDFDLGGHTLKLRGAQTGQISFNPGNTNQRMTLRNGTFEFSSGSTTGLRCQVMIAGTGNTLTFMGTDDEPMSISGSTATYELSSGGLMVWTNVVANQVRVQGNGTAVLTGSKTKVRQIGNDYAGVLSDSNCKLVLENGAYLEAINGNGTHKVDFRVGGTAGGLNAFVVAGADTCLVVTNKDHPASSPGVASIAVGYQSNGNLLHITDHATVNCSSKLLIGNPQSDTTRGSACKNFIRIDSNAVVTAADIIVGQRANRDNYTYQQPLPSFASNTCVIADGARVTLKQNGLMVGTEFTVSDSAIIVSNRAVVTSRLNAVGAAGSSNRIEVVDGGVLYCKESGLDWGVRVGGTASTGAVFVVDGGVLAATNCLLQMNGAAPGQNAVTRFANGADAYVEFLRTKNTGNRIEFDDAALVVRLDGKFPYYDDSSVEFAFSGRRAQLDYKYEDSSTYTEPFGFYAGTSFSFNVPAGGYAGAPIKSAKGITIQNLTACTIDLKAFAEAGGERQVLMQAGGSNTINIDAASLAVMQAAASAAGGKIKLSADNKQLILSVNKGLLLLIR